MCDEDDEMDFDDWIAAGCPIADQQAVTKAVDLINRARAADTRVTLWGQIVDRGWCPLLHGGRGLIRYPDDVTRIFL